MSKHTNKVHGKLNFLIVAVVLVVGVLGYLLVQSDTIDFNPSDLSSSGNKAIKGVKKAEKYDNRSEVVVDLDGEEIQDFLNNQDFTKMIANPEFAKIAGNSAALEMLASPAFAKLAGNADALNMLAMPNALQMLALPEFQKMMSFDDF